MTTRARPTSQVATQLAMQDAITTLATMLKTDYVPRQEHEARWTSQVTVMDGLREAVEKLNDSVQALRSELPRDYTSRTDFDKRWGESQSDRAGLRHDMDELRKRTEVSASDIAQLRVLLSEKTGAVALTATQAVANQRIALDSRLLGWLIAGGTALVGAYLAGGHVMLH